MIHQDNFTDKVTSLFKRVTGKMWISADGQASLMWETRYYATITKINYDCDARIQAVTETILEKEVNVFLKDTWT